MPLLLLTQVNIQHAPLAAPSASSTPIQRHAGHKHKQQRRERGITRKHTVNVVDGSCNAHITKSVRRPGLVCPSDLSRRPPPCHTTQSTRNNSKSVATVSRLTKAATATGTSKNSSPTGLLSHCTIFVHTLDDSPARVVRHTNRKHRNSTSVHSLGFTHIGAGALALPVSAVILILFCHRSRMHAEQVLPGVHCGRRQIDRVH